MKRNLFDFFERIEDKNYYGDDDNRMLFIVKIATMMLTKTRTMMMTLTNLKKALQE